MNISPMSTIRILHVIARMNVGGTSSYVGELVKEIPGSALATGYVQEGEIEDPILNSLQTFRVPHLGRKISPIKDLRALFELRKIVKNIDPQILHTHTFKAGVIGRLLGGDLKRVHTFHGHLFNDQSFSRLEKKFINVTERFLALRTHLLISVGIKVGMEIRTQGIGARGNWKSISPGVTPLTLINQTEARNFLGLDQNQLLFGWMARMAEVKNPYLLLEVAKRLPRVKFVMAGGGRLLEEIRDVAPENISVIGWTKAATFWSAVDCAISTSHGEGMSIALIEAQLAGIPVISTDVGSNSEVVRNGITGIVTEKNVGSLVSAVELLNSNKDLLTSMGKAAKIWATGNFSKEKMLQIHEQYYEELLSQ